MECGSVFTQNERVFHWSGISADLCYISPMRLRLCLFTRRIFFSQAVASFLFSCFYTAGHFTVDSALITFN